MRQSYKKIESQEGGKHFFTPLHILTAGVNVRVAVCLHELALQYIGDMSRPVTAGRLQLTTSPEKKETNPELNKHNKMDG